MNLPNTLSLIRVLLVPAFVATLIFMREIKWWGIIVPAIVYALTALTDMLDGRIARKRNLITDFGKFLDPVADKIMVFGAFAGLIVMNLDDRVFVIVMSIASFIFFFRETAVTSMRMIVGTASGVVIAANILGKIKTVSQIVFVLVALLEPLLWQLAGLDLQIFTYLTLVFMTVMTVWSGISYFVAYFPYIDPQK